MTDFRALCAELVEALAEWQLGGGPPEDTADADLIDRARAALAQPEPVAPTDEAPEKDAPVWYNSDMASSWQAGRQDGWSDAIARYGTPTNTINQEG